MAFKCIVNSGSAPASPALQPSMREIKRMNRNARRQANGNPSRDTENFNRRSSSRCLAASAMAALSSSASVNLASVPKAALRRTAIVTLIMLSAIA
jgi:hypothetical protein